MSDGQGSGATSAAVMADAQFSNARILRPIEGFENLYQNANASTPLLGIPPSIPVAFFEVGTTKDGRDVDAGKTGFDPNLMAYFPVPMGSLIKLWIPIFTNGPANPLSVQAYRYAVHWRVSDIKRYVRMLAGQYHLGREQPGAPDSTVAPPAPRFVTPSADRAILINQIEALGFSGQNTNVRREYLVVRAGEPSDLPILPPGAPPNRGVYQQGIIDPLVDPAFGPQSSFVEFEIIAGGDRMLITADRFGIDGASPPVASDWNFDPTGLDFGFSNIYGTAARGTPHPAFNEVGIYVFYGSAP